MHETTAGSGGENLQVKEAARREGAARSPVPAALHQIIGWHGRKATHHLGRAPSADRQGRLQQTALLPRHGEEGRTCLDPAEPDVTGKGGHAAFHSCPDPG